VTIPLDRKQFLAEFRLRNRGLIGEEDQRNLSEATFLVAGCGSTGGATIEPLVRAGAMSFILVEPGEYEIHNLNRQRANLEAIGENKGAWLAKQAKSINPFVDVEVHEEGISSQNATSLCERASLIMDAVDVTTLEGLDAKCALHEAAAIARRPVISAYDLAYRQFVRIYDYRRPQRPLQGKIARIRRAKLPTDALALLIPFSALPYDMLGEIERLQKEPGASISQLGCAADLFGALAVPLVLEILAGRAVRKSYTLDLKEPALPMTTRIARRVATLAGLARLQMRRWLG
jgi:molybdopterin/thiamine biosynthesis adenylyltransferase